MRKIVALGLVCVIAAIAVPAFAAQTEGNPTTQAQVPATPNPSAQPCVPLKKIFARKNWRDSHPARGVNACPGPVRKYRDAFRLYRTYRLVAPYRGFNEGDPWLKWLSVPAYIVACETRGFSGEGRWHAANSSGAVGPYQLLGWGAPYPANTPKEKVENHVIASHLSLSNWACA